MKTKIAFLVAIALTMVCLGASGDIIFSREYTSENPVSWVIHETFDWRENPTSISFVGPDWTFSGDSAWSNSSGTTTYEHGVLEFDENFWGFPSPETRALFGEFTVQSYSQFSSLYDYYLTFELEDNGLPEGYSPGFYVSLTIQYEGNPSVEVNWSTLGINLSGQADYTRIDLIYDPNHDPIVVPEPTTLSLMAIGGAGLICYRRRRKPKP